MLKPFFTYYGGKFRIAPRYPNPVYNTIIEPFAGSAGYSLRHPHLKIHLNDKNPIVAGLWKYLINVRESEIRSLPVSMQHVDAYNICEEAKWLIGFWYNKGSSGPRKTPSKWARSGIRPDSHWGEAIRERIASQLLQIRHWTISSVDYRDFIHDREGTWFIDPPYSSAAGNCYPERIADFESLGQWCLKRRGQIIVCESMGASWLPFEPFMIAKASEGKRGGKRIHEVIFHRDCEQKSRKKKFKSRLKINMAG